MGDKRSAVASCSVVSDDELTLEEFQCSGRVGRRFALAGVGVVVESGGGSQADAGPLLFKEVTSRMSRMGSAATAGAAGPSVGGGGGGGSVGGAAYIAQHNRAG